jgi:formylglycine-generating enzyme required for sulfatase activity
MMPGRRRTIALAAAAALCLTSGVILGFHRGLPPWLGGVSRDDATPHKLEAEKLWAEVRYLDRSHGVGDRLDAGARTLADARGLYEREDWRDALAQFEKFAAGCLGISQIDAARRSMRKQRDVVVRVTEEARRTGASTDAPPQWQELERLLRDAQSKTEAATDVPALQYAERAWQAAANQIYTVERAAQTVRDARAAVAVARQAWLDALERAPARSVLDVHAGTDWAKAETAEADADAAAQGNDFARAETQYARATALLPLAIRALLPDGWTLSPKTVPTVSPEGELHQEILYYTNSVAMDFVLIPAGEFMMGSTKSEPGERGNEQPRHKVRLTKSYFMAATELTQAHYKALMGKNPSWLRKGDNVPVHQVSWNDAIAFCAALSKRDGARYRLPTEAEWEYACRAGTTTPFSAGASLRPGLANYCPKYGTPRGETYRKELAPVAEYPANPWGLYDMHGNAKELCQDWSETLYYKRSPAQDPPGPTKGTHRVLRGGVYYDDPTMCRSAFRGKGRPHVPFQSHGIRVVCDIPQSAENL